MTHNFIVQFTISLRAFLTCAKIHCWLLPPLHAAIFTEWSTASMQLCPSAWCMAFDWNKIIQRIILRPNAIIVCFHFLLPHYRTTISGCPYCHDKMRFERAILHHPLPSKIRPCEFPIYSKAWTLDYLPESDTAPLKPCRVPPAPRCPYRCWTRCLIESASQSRQLDNLLRVRATFTLSYSQ